MARFSPTHVGRSGRIALATIAAAAAPLTFAEAQVTGATADDLLQEVVVTARGRVEELQSVPLAITVLDSTALERSGVENIREIAYLTPGLTIRSLGAEYGVRPVIRGQADISGGIGDPNVAVFLDGIYLSNGGNVNLAMMNIERVEVVKGPVSALYGRNAANGAINYVTRVPGDELYGRITAQGGSDDLRVVTGSVSGPVIADLLSLGIGFNYEEYEGAYSDPVTGEQAGGREKRNVQGTFRLTPLEDLTINGAWYYGDDEFGFTAQAPFNPNCGVPRAVASTVPGATLLAPFSVMCGELDASGRTIRVPGSGAGTTGHDREVHNASLRAEYAFGAGSLSYLGGYNDISSQRLNDFSAGQPGVTIALYPSTGMGALPFPATGGAGTTVVRPFFGQSLTTYESSHEVRFSSRDDQRFRYQLGGFRFETATYTVNKFAIAGDIPADSIFGRAAASGGAVVVFPNLGYDSVTSSDGALNPDNITASRGEAEQTSYFVAVDFDVSDQLTLSGEYRDVDETRRLFGISSFNFGGTRSLPNTANFSADFSYDDYRVTARYKPTDETMLYASIGTGTKAGGFNTGPVSPQFAFERTYQPEENTTYEIGFKSDLFDRSLKLNVAAFHIETTDLQFFQRSANPSNLGLIVSNVGGVTTNGIELELALTPFERSTFSLGIGYADPQIDGGVYTNFNNVAGCLLIPTCAPRVETIVTPQGNAQAINLGGLQTAATSERQYRFSAELEGDAWGEWDWFARGDYSYESKQFGDVLNTYWQGERNLVNVRFGVYTSKLRISAFVDNLFEDLTPEGIGASTRISDTGFNQFGVSLPTDRVLGVAATYSFGN
jgi:outer membrane receptor protein involved in Fe transport